MGGSSDENGNPDPAAMIVSLKLDGELAARRSPEIEQERDAAIYDLLEENSFRLAEGAPGPYDVLLGLDGGRLVIQVRAEDETHINAFGLALGPFRRIIRDYFHICDAYYDAIRKLSPSQIEAIDMGRRGIHNDGAELLAARLTDKIHIDHGTARRLFTLLCALHRRDGR